ncbi:DNA-processing protein DprA [Magnetospira sp. QH-2]|uniref:DNA-processing protein DprA n=1 Tax=Magnetospira sp. (strain QH-2) TaxID=1288970 RepID=UPI0005F9D20C|nr:DNA-processing protein DprA [Magnetospira sp. QH-2]
MDEKTLNLPVSEKLDWLRLIRSENVGPITFHGLLQQFGSARAALDALPDLARRGGRKKLKVASRAQAEKEIEAARAMGARLIAAVEPDYPPLLAQTEDAPPLIYLLGHAHLLRKKAVAVVGARNASVNGCHLAERLSRDLGQGGLLVVSGMARGIDAAAHRGALATGTVAVLAGGVDHIYPKQNKELYARIRDMGALIAESPPGTVPQARHFPSRNRLISGMSRGVLVVEAAPRSGSLITARLALDQGREVFSVPGSPLDPRSHGTNDLLRQGAVLVETADEILDQVKTSGSASLKEPRQSFPSAVSPTELAPVPAPEDRDSARDLITNSLGPSPVSVDEIIRRCQFSPAVVATVLLELELSSRLERHPGNRVSLIHDG